MREGFKSPMRHFQRVALYATVYVPRKNGRATRQYHIFKCEGEGQGSEARFTLIFKKLATVLRGVFHIISNYFALNSMFILGSSYWNMEIGRDPGDIYKDGKDLPHATVRKWHKQWQATFPKRWDAELAVARKLAHIFRDTPSLCYDTHLAYLGEGHQTGIEHDKPGYEFREGIVERKKELASREYS